VAKTVNMHEAKTQFSKLAKLVEGGQEVLIARNGEVIMKLVPFEVQLSEPRDFSRLKALTPNFTDEEWAELDKQILDSIVYSEDEI
jgi:antitoxin (DNA-binding transcriptional repressor) of toxin-antitoxin stability system